jgi:hypothetical protein
MKNDIYEKRTKIRKSISRTNLQDPIAISRFPHVRPGPKIAGFLNKPDLEKTRIIPPPSGGGYRRDGRSPYSSEQ